ncbi:hypothetical protein B1992_08215 [Pseudoxanthomonas broegbernensis]|uniref:Serine/threonine protein kinase n=1 Tax=Pseudoxanthomonas broegbernensis TaxID=83619 RepID=A0A7V8GMN8_9GAMM|nr:hypothetical protein [Pseudoxanthomonas broegbernensis]KAF1686521.1 hypothetical protein B1992_08215 [Pseudoxanthomonas broegbernensis]MBB6064217.1 hypothetical protein [Pseudoxanthomonas broegbernensis]
MDATMELDELKQAWQVLGQRLERQETIQWQLLRERKLDRLRSGLRPLAWTQALQMLLGIGLIVLGVGCWTGNTGVPGLFWSGLLVHAFGVAHAALAGITLGLLGTIDYAAPVLRIQKQLSRLRGFHVFNAAVCGAPWWIMWLPVVVAFAGFGTRGQPGPTPGWVAISLAIGVAGLLATYALAWRAHRRARSRNAAGPFDNAGVERARALLGEIAEFERE